VTGSKKTIRTNVRLGLWTLAWVITMAIVTFGPKFLWAGNDTLTIAGIALNLSIGLGIIFANYRHIQSLDELHQKVQLEATALALGIAVVVDLELDVSRQTVSAIEKGKFDPSLPLAFKAARLFEMSIEDIFQDDAAS
jgi:hypothetical protein